MVGFGNLKVAEERSERFGQGKSVALTFDDGPEPESALQAILAALAAHTPPIRAEFYVIGEKVKAKPRLLSLILGGNHKIQNHTWDHPNITPSFDEEKIFNEVEDTQVLIKKITGMSSTKVRPPFGTGGFPGHINPKLRSVGDRLHLKIENWDIDTCDWAATKGLGNDPILREKGKPKRHEFIKRQFKEAKGDPSRLIILMHVRPETARDLPAFIAQLEAWGFDFAVPTD
jgi:peptidoglycan-N-acetylglucosamine deacetylase